MQKLLALPFTVPFAALRGALSGAVGTFVDAVSNAAGRGGDEGDPMVSPERRRPKPTPQRAAVTRRSAPGRRPASEAADSASAAPESQSPQADSETAQDVAEELALREGHLEEPEPELIESEGSATPGGELHVREPWPGYAKLRAADIVDRLSGGDAATRAIVRLYESTHRNRRSVIDATAATAAP
jgi:hypothetical protein